MPSVMAVSKRRDFLGNFLLPAGIGFSCSSHGQGAAGEKLTFSPYILRAVEAIAAAQSGRGYLKQSSFSHDLTFGSENILKSKAPPYTMCVAAVFEVIVTAINLYSQQSGDRSPHTFLPFTAWNRLRPFDLKGQIWMVQKSDSYGTAHALQKFGMGAIRDFSSLEPGSFLNLNRNNRSGHAVVFVDYINKVGDVLPYYSQKVAGFKYFSSQGSEKNGGFGFRYAFFSDVGCPVLKGDKRKDCGVIRSSDAMLLNAGVMWHPNFWNKSSALNQLSKEAYHILQGNNEMLVDGDYDASYFNGRTTDD